MSCSIWEVSNYKFIKSEEFNLIFDKKTGYTEIWGKTRKDDPVFCEYGPIIADIEVTDICHGIMGKDGKRVPCKFCYKANTPSNTGNMSLETFKKIVDKLPKTVTQIAFGADATGTANPDLFAIMRYSREKGIIPNITLAEVSEEMAELMASVVGAIAISYYPTRDKNVCYDSVKRMTDAGITQVNIHAMVSEESFSNIIELLNDIKTDERLKKLNALVLLSLKPKGRGTSYTQLNQELFNFIVNTALENKISIGFDSCSAPKFLKSVEHHKDFERFKMCSEPCESSLQSSYINYKGEYFPCSFCEGEGEWKEGLDVLSCEDFVENIWKHPKTNAFRDKLLKNTNCMGCRQCPIFKV